jgi:hypothetical protein
VLGGPAGGTIRGAGGLGRNDKNMLEQSRITSFFLSNKFEFLSKTILFDDKKIILYSCYQRQFAHNQVSVSRKLRQGSQ